MRERDLRSTIADADARIRQLVPLPPGCRVTWAGEFQQLQEALDRLRVVVPLTLALIFCLLYGYFRNVPDTVIVLGSVPLALIGGILALLATRTDFSISAAVGFICVLGVVVLNGVVLIASISGHRAQGAALEQAVLTGARERLRAVMMVSAAAGIGLLPAAVATGVGSETQRLIARVVVGSMITAPMLTLLVLPALYLLVHRLAEARAVQQDAGALTGRSLAADGAD